MGLKTANFKFAKGLLDAVIAGLSRRFKYIFDKPEQPLIATFSHPFFKARWMESTGVDMTLEVAVALLLAATKGFVQN